MVSRSLAFGLVAAACVVAAGGGAYIATLQHERHDSAIAASQTAPAQASRPGAEAAALPMSQSAAQPPVAAAPSPAEQPLVPPPSAAAPLAQPSPDDVPATPRPATRARAAEKGRTRAASGRVAGNAAAGSARADEGVHAAPAPQAQAAPAQVQQAPAPVPAPVDVPEREQQVQPEPERMWEELTVPRESVIGLQLETPLNSETARVEDRVDARVTREVRVDGRVAIPVGAHALGNVTMVERGGKIRERARLGVRFNTLILADGTRLPLATDTVFREGEAPSAQSSAKIGGAAIGGAIIGAILGGGKGAAIGSGIGAAGGTAAAMAGDRHPVVLPVGTPLSVRMQTPLTVTVEK